MADTQSILKYAREVGVGDVRIYKIVLSGGAQAFTLDDSSWGTVYSITAVPSTTSSGVGEIIFDGTNIKGAGFAANDTIILKVVGKAG